MRRSLGRRLTKAAATMVKTRKRCYEGGSTDAKTPGGGEIRRAKSCKTDKMLSTLLDMFQKQYGSDAKNDYPFAQAFKLCSHNLPNIQRVLYPGCYIHVTPSFVFPEVVYVDSYKGKSNIMQKFFQNENVLDQLVEQRCYSQPKQITYRQSDYRSDFGEELESFDMLLSFSAGSISSQCLKYVKREGILFADDEHADASIASTNPELRLIAAVQGSRWPNKTSSAANGDNLKWVTDVKQLKDLFKVKKTKKPITLEQALENSKVGRSKWPYPLFESNSPVLAYVFRKL
mmetsp:Transcript_14018/g.17376  ORF Transcript_14018/g.17376 Transcript_14018/m.17376 type:complete len:288 (-) Transcript_14018:349-1212(-)